MGASVTRWSAPLSPPLSFVVTGAKRRDLTQRDAVLSNIMVKRKLPADRRSQHLCLDAGYRGEPALQIIEGHGDIAHVVSRTSEKKAEQRHPRKKARHRIVEVCHSWINRFRKLLVRYEKLEGSFLAINHLAPGIIAMSEVHLEKINTICGYKPKIWQAGHVTEPAPISMPGYPFSRA